MVRGALIRLPTQVDSQLRFLIVDDMPAMRSIVRNMLEELGFARIEDAEDGETAWQLIRQSVADPEQAFGFVISDWNMPGMSGVDLLRAVRAFPHTRELPFLMVTAEGDQSHVNEALRAGVTDYVVKPFNSTQLREKIDQAMAL